jgi:hypothetical protein
MMEITVGQGDQKRKVQVTDAEDNSLRWYAENAKNDAIRDACVAELERRAGAEESEKAPVPPQQTAIARRPTQQSGLENRDSAGILRTPEEAFAKTQQLAKSCHLVNAPSAGCAIPDGCGIAWTTTFLDIASDTYAIPGGTKRGLGKDALNKIARDMGASWDPERSRRLDNCSHPHYCRYLAVGIMRDFDGTWITISDEKEVDLREGSDQAKLMTEKQLAQQRSNIQSLAITKARNRAIRGRGVSCGYEAKALEKPFVSFRIMFTGESSDPEIRRMKARAMLDGERALYGRPSATTANRLLPVPPVGSVADDELGPNGVAVGEDEY